MPAVTLPVLSPEFRKVIPRLPNAPADPPTIDDAAKSCVIAFRALDTRLHTDHDVTNGDIVQTVQYQTKVMAEIAGGEPPWFEASMTRVLDPLNAKLDALVEEVRMVRRMAALSWNRTHGITSDALLQVVPFPDGSDPTKEPHNLPAITSVGMVRTLGYNNKETYFKNYFEDEPIPAAAQLNNWIIEAIGVRRDFY